MYDEEQDESEDLTGGLYRGDRIASENRYLGVDEFIQLSNDSRRSKRPAMVHDVNSDNYREMVERSWRERNRAA